MKKGFVFLLLSVSLLFTFSCSDTKSYGEMLKDEKNAIKQMIQDSAFVILDDFPADSVFKPNEFVQLDGGIYMNVIEWGNEKRAVENKTVTYVRFKVRGLLGTDTAYVDITGNGAYPTSFTYPLNADYGYPFSESSSLQYAFLSEGTSLPLKYVGENGIVKLIVPFKRGSEYDQTNGQPRYYAWLKYTKFD